MPNAQNIIDHNDFSTETGYLKPGESDFRSELCLNGTWDFQPVALPDGFAAGDSTPDLPLPKPDKWESAKLKVPSPWNINGLVDGDGVPGGDFNCYPSYPESWKYVKMGWMRRTLRVPEDWLGKSILLHFEAVCGHCQVYIDGQKIGEHFDNSMPSSYPIDAFVTPGKAYELWVGVRAPELMNINNGPTKYTYPTGSFFNMNATGIWQDVVLLGVPEVRIKDIFVQPDVSADKLRMQATLENRSRQAASLRVSGVVKALKPFSIPDDGIQVVPHYELEDDPDLEFPGAQITVAAGTEAVLTLEVNVSGKLLAWDTDNPNLYGSLVTLEQNGETVDRKYTRFGWREFKIRDGDFYLNDHTIRIKGDSWHFMGIPQLTRRYAFAWYRALQDAGGNGIRLHAMPYPTFYLEVADEMGVCILDESAIWASHCQFNYDEPVTWERFYDHVTSLVLRDRNYPSVMGWSVENEIRMALARYSPTEETMTKMQEKACKLMDIARDLDPTRDWISADGSLDWFGRFPTFIAHYVPKEMYGHAKQEIGKPLGIGEGTIGYFGTPVHASAFAGDLAFRSIEDRMKGVAVEAYGDLKAQFLADFSYMSVFNLAWYGLKPLPLGHANPENAPTVENGILFGAYQEGKPGVQPERLGPYCSTFNPGYDPDLPLYSPWPLYDAIKSAFSPGGPQPSPYETEIVPPPQKPLPQVDHPAPVVFLGSPNSVYYQGLQDSGVRFSQDQAGTLVFADVGSLSPEQATSLTTRLEELKSSGGTVLLSGLTPASEPLLETLIGEKIEIFAREASSLVFAGEYADTDPLVDHFRLQELYFSEAEDTVVQRYGIRTDGLHNEGTRNAKALLKACSCDWRMWNRRGESSKTGALYRGERELPEANTLVMLTAGKARILLCALEMTGHPSASKLRLSAARKLVWNKLMKAAGAEVRSDFGREAQALEGARLVRVLAAGYLVGRNPEQLLDLDLLNGESEAAPAQGDAIIRGDFTTHWQTVSAEPDGFQFKDMGFSGPKDNSAGYLSFYLNSPRRIDDLLSEPNVPELTLNLETACGIRVWLNGEEIFTQAEVSAEPVKLRTRLLLGQGSNHILIKVVNTDTDYVVRAYLSSTDGEYIGKLESSVVR